MPPILRQPKSAAIFWAALVLYVSALALSGAELRALPGHVPSVVSKLAPLQRMAPTNHLSLAVALPLRDPSGLTNFLQQLYDPSSPQFRHFLTPVQFTERFGPSSEDYEGVLQYARANGFVVTHTHANRLLVNVDTTVANIEKAFSLHLNLYQHPNESRHFFAPDRNPSLPKDVPALEICGLNNYPTLCAADGAGLAPQIPGYIKPNDFVGNDYRAAYVPGVTENGAGQTVALIEFDGFDPNAINQYAALIGVSNVLFTNILLDGATGAFGTVNGGPGEVAGDIEMVMSMAPGAQIVCYEGSFANPQSFSAPFVDVMNQIALDNTARQISCSWGYRGNSLVSPAADEIFQEFAAQGQSFFQGAGDWGADWASYANPPLQTNWTYWPADNPYVTSVGGTELSTTGPGGAWVSETVWNNRTDLRGGYAGTGGVSPNYSIPSWQKSIDMSANGGSAGMRNVPDVAMVADGIGVVETIPSYPGPVSFSEAGTSFATPLWAAFVALANQRGASNNQPPLGFINPTIYQLASGPNYSSLFHDVTLGDNTNLVSGNQFYAQPGYDLCTGWGSPIGQNLLGFLLHPTEPFSILPATGFDSANGGSGNPFNITSQTYTLTNNGSDPFTWSLANTSPWLCISPTNGALMVGASASLTASLRASTAGLPAGNYDADVWFTNLASGVAQNRHFTLEVAQPLIKNGGFETADLSDWTANGYWNHYRTGSEADIASPGGAHSGDYVGIFYGTSQNLYQPETYLDLSQSVATAPGQRYLLSLWLGGNSDMRALWNGATIFEGTNLEFGSGAYNTYSNLKFEVAAAGTAATFVIHFEGNFSMLMDDVSLIPLLPPRLQAVAASDGSIGFTWNAINDLTYQIQFTTDLGQTNWTNFDAPVTATDATMTVSYPIASDAQRFYRVVLLVP
ncbi:MAG TPA: protease pro-enzyme activation domain-containing protein [Verrucomicrobiae bacterium]|jgi:hypothetical protein|nr:protease pro-enzyme activation domain-containing protein [Verrucomicrobiae bacterium]